MKILREGKVPNSRTTILTCVNCKAEVEVEKGEMTYQDDPRDGGFYSVGCPTYGCGAYLYAYPKNFL